MLPRLSAKAALTALLLLLLAGESRSQLSTYASVTYGRQSNPLYNHEGLDDQVRMAYLEVAYTSELLVGTYIGGLTIFDELTRRNYLDQSLRLALLLRPADSAGAAGEIFARVAGRHDKAAYRDYDNGSVGLGGSLRLGDDGWHIRLNTEGGYRRYPYLNELSNASAILTVEAGLGGDSGFSFGLRPLVGMKHFLAAAYDTTRFEPERTYVTVTNPGSGKGGAKIVVQTSSGKGVLANADIRTVGHLAGTGSARFGWGAGSVECELGYRHNLTASARILARTAEAATINEDLYDDFFSYSGPEARLVLRQAAPFSIQTIITVSYQRKLFGAPAFDLEGMEIAGARIDRRSGIELYASRYIDLSSDWGLDVALSGAIGRNESNDLYNDFSGWSLGVSFGVGF